MTVCDVNSTIDIASMQENIRNYKKLESDKSEYTLAYTDYRNSS